MDVEDFLPGIPGRVEDDPVSGRGDPPVRGDPAPGERSRSLPKLPSRFPRHVGPTSRMNCASEVSMRTEYETGSSSSTSPMAARTFGASRLSSSGVSDETR